MLLLLIEQFICCCCDWLIELVRFLLNLSKGYFFSKIVIEGLFVIDSDYFSLLLLFILLLLSYFDFSCDNCIELFIVLLFSFDCTKSLLFWWLVLMFIKLSECLIDYFSVVVLFCCCYCDWFDTPPTANKLDDNDDDVDEFMSILTLDFIVSFWNMFYLPSIWFTEEN